jgi:hypothetical protein
MDRCRHVRGGRPRPTSPAARTSMVCLPGWNLSPRQRCPDVPARLRAYVDRRLWLCPCDLLLFETRFQSVSMPRGRRPTYPSVSPGQRRGSSVEYRAHSHPMPGVRWSAPTPEKRWPVEYRAHSHPMPGVRWSAPTHEKRWPLEYRAHSHPMPGVRWSAHTPEKRWPVDYLAHSHPMPGVRWSAHTPEKRWPVDYLAHSHPMPDVRWSAPTPEKRWERGTAANRDTIGARTTV